MKNDECTKFLANLVSVIKAKRKELGISHLKLAESCGISRSAISMIESGDRVPTIATCYKISKALNINLSELIKEAE